MPVSLRRLILIVAAIEVAVFIGTRLILAHWSGWEWQSEAMRTGLRAGAAFALWYFFRSLIFGATPQPGRDGRPLLAASIAVLLAVPFLIGDWHFMGPVARIVCAVTSIFVGLHEEFLFRGIVQNLLVRRLGLVAAIVVTSMVMTVWHLGAIPLLAFNFFQVFVASCVLGLIYAGTGSMRLVVLIHTAYDAIWPLTPLWPGPLPVGWGAGLLLASLALAWLWLRGAGFDQRPKAPHLF